MSSTAKYLLINYCVLVIGLLLIAVFWNVISRNRGEKEKKEVHRYNRIFFVLGLVMFTIQYITVG